jgi:hypothetical protein
MHFLKKVWSLILFTAFLFSCTSQQKSSSELTVKNVMDDVITRLYQEVPADRYSSIDDAYMLDMFSEDEKEELAT